MAFMPDAADDRFREMTGKDGSAADQALIDAKTEGIKAAAWRFDPIRMPGFDEIRSRGSAPACVHRYLTFSRRRRRRASNLPGK